MPFNNALDSYELESLALPFDTLTKPLSDNPRLLAGKDMYASVSGKLQKRPGLQHLTNTDVGRDRIERLLVYEVTPVSGTPLTPQVYIIGSFLNAVTGHYYLSYLNLNWNGDPNNLPHWQSFPDKRGCNYSQYPHEMVTSREVVYIKSFPDSSAPISDMLTKDGSWLGTICFDGNYNPPQIRNWGVDAPTDPSVVQKPMSTSAPVGSTTVYLGWRYAYAWKSKAGHLSCHSPSTYSGIGLNSNTTDPSFTGPFTDKCPVVSFDSHPDLTEYPTVVIYRTFDGGGVYYELDEVTNDGVTYLYTDNKYNGAPKPDSLLNTASRAPSISTNAPPPFTIHGGPPPYYQANVFPERTTPLATYAGRIFFGIGSLLFFSGNEEVIVGIPEECFPTGLTGNFYQFEHPIVSIAATYQALYIFTTHEVYWLRGTTLDTFQLQLLFGDVGMANQPGALCIQDTAVYWMTNDYRVMMAVGPQRQVLSNPLGPIIKQHLVDPSVQIKFTRYAAMDRNWLLMSFYHQASFYAAMNGTYVFNFDPNILSWNVPWIFNATAMTTGKAFQQDLMPRLIVATQGATQGQSALTSIDIENEIFQDWDPDAAAYKNYNCFAVFSPVRNPLGNHVNPLRLPGMTSALYSIKLDRTQLPGDLDPTVTYWLDDTEYSSINGTVLTGVDPPRRIQSRGHRTLWYFVNTVCERVLLEINVPAQPSAFELQSLAFTWNPDGGA